MSSVTGITLGAAGARGAYEVGALIELLPVLDGRGEAPQVIAGASSGAMNAVALAGLRHLPHAALAAEARSRWAEIVLARVVGSVVLRQLPLLAARYAGTVLGLPGVRLPALTDPAPLRRHLPGWLDLPQVHRNVDAGTVARVAVVTADARTGRPTVFVEGEGAVPPSETSLRWVRTRLAPEHVRASAAIPLVFPPVSVETPPDVAGWYLDGGARASSPVPIARALGADRLVVIAASSLGGGQQTGDERPDLRPALADAAAQVIEGLLGDRLVRDLGDLEADGAAHLVVAPAPGAIAERALAVLHHRRRGRRVLRNPGVLALDRLLGGEGPLHGEVMSYLLFDDAFLHELIELGRQDARAALAARGGDPWAPPERPLTSAPADGTAA